MPPTLTRGLPTSIPTSQRFDLTSGVRVRCSRDFTQVTGLDPRDTAIRAIGVAEAQATSS